MDSREKSRLFQRVKSLSVENFFNYLNGQQTQAYGLGITHMEQAMSCHQRISRPMIEQVLKKAEQIRIEWDGIEEVTIESAAIGQYRTPEEMMLNMSSTEAAIYKLESDSYVEIGGKTFYVKPVQEAEENE